MAILLDEDLAENETGHLAAHAELRTAYLSRGSGRAMTELLDTMTQADFRAAHRAVHNQLHAEHNALGAAGVLPNPVGTAGHLEHHRLLHIAHNLRNRKSAVGVGTITQSNTVSCVSSKVAANRAGTGVPIMQASTLVSTGARLAAAMPTTDLAYRLVADDLTGADSSAQGTWNPRTGSGAAAQATANNQPLLKVGALNGHNTLAFDGLKHTLALSGSALSLSRNKPYLTISIIYRTPSYALTSGVRTLFGMSTGTATTTARTVIQHRNTDGVPVALGRQLDTNSSVAAIGTGTSTGTSEVMILTAIYRWNTSDLLLFKNGTQIAARTDFQADGLTSDTASLAGAIGSNTAGTAEFYPGEIAEIAVHNSADLTGDLVKQLSAYAAATYGSVDTTAPTDTSQPMPATDLPGWKLVYAEDFTKTAALGQIETVYPEIPQYKNFQDTSKNGTYRPDKVLSAGMRPDVADSKGVLDFWMHSEIVNGTSQHMVACPIPGGYTGRLLVRHETRFRVDRPIPLYKIAFLLWTTPDEWDEELDFAEGGLNGGSIEHNHHALGASTPYPINTGVQIGVGWHTSRVEITDKSTRYYVDGVRTLTATFAIPQKLKRSGLQAETNLNSSTPPADSTEGHLMVDWYTIHEGIAGYDYTTTDNYTFVAATGAALPGPWTTVRGTAAVDTNRAKLTSTTAQWNSAMIRLNAMFSDGKLTALRVTPPATGGTAYFGYRFNAALDSGYVMALSGTGVFRIGRWVNASVTWLGNSVTLDLSGGKVWNLAVEPSAGNHKARAWLDGTTEPTTWDIGPVADYNGLRGEVVAMSQTSVSGTAATTLVDDVKIYTP